MTETMVLPKIARSHAVLLGWRMLGRAVLGDRRRVRRAVQLLTAWLLRPGASVTKACRDAASAKAAYRLLANPKVTADDLGAAIYTDAARQCAALPVVHIAMDTTTLTWGDREPIQGLGPADSHGTQGMLVHTSLALGPDGTPLGLLHQLIWERPPEKLPPKEKRELRDRESYKWRDGMEACGSRLPEGCRPVFIFDREGDIHEVFALAVARDWGVIVRARHNRKVAGETDRLFAAVRDQEVALRYTLKVPRKPGSAPAREARMALRHATVTLTPNSHKVPGREPVTVGVVLATEETPGETKPLEWILVTTEPVKTATEARAVAERYAWRWRVEEFHLVLKSGCKMESHQFDYADRLEKVVVLLSAVAAEIARLTYLGRTQPEIPASTALDDRSLIALDRWARGTRNRLPPGPLLLKDAIRLIGRLGGHLGRKGDGPVGVRTFWEGWRRLQDMALMILPDADKTCG